MIFCCCCFFQEKFLLEAMYDVPGSDIKTVIVTEDTIRNSTAPDVIRETPETLVEEDYEEEELKMHHS